jgi:hypothetical protein
MSQCTPAQQKFFLKNERKQIRFSWKNDSSKIFFNDSNIPVAILL